MGGSFLSCGLMLGFWKIWWWASDQSAHHIWCQLLTSFTVYQSFPALKPYLSQFQAEIYNVCMPVWHVEILLVQWLCWCMTQVGFCKCSKRNLASEHSSPCKPITFHNSWSGLGCRKSKAQTGPNVVVPCEGVLHNQQHNWTDLWCWKNRNRTPYVPWMPKPECRNVTGPECAFVCHSLIWPKLIFTCLRGAHCFFFSDIAFSAVANLLYFIPYTHPTLYMWNTKSSWERFNIKYCMPT